MFRRDSPYNDLPALPPACEIETRLVLKATIAASRALAQLNGMVERLPNPTLLIDTLNLQEARASSEIENIITTDDELYQASISELAVEDAATKEVLRYKEALWFGYKELTSRNRPLSTNLFIQLVQRIKSNQAAIRNTPGTQLKNPASGEVIYTPPEGENIIRDKLADLENFIHAQDGLDPLVKMAVIHYQFEAIHPFSDGNGRTGRIINILYLIQSEVLYLPVLYLSQGIIKDKTNYYRLLREVTEDYNWEAWILYMLKKVEETALDAQIKIAAVTEAMKDFSLQVQQRFPKIYSKDLIEILFRAPYTKRKFLVEEGIGSLKTVGEYLITLENAGLLDSVQVGKEKLYLNNILMDILKS